MGQAHLWTVVGKLNTKKSFQTQMMFKLGR